MKSTILKTISVASFILILSASFALAYDGRYTPRGPANGHYKEKVVYHYHHPAPPPVCYPRHYRPVVVARPYPHQPIRYIRPGGFVLGVSFFDAAAGAAFSFGVGGR